MTKLALPLSITLLACAVALNAVGPAHAEAPQTAVCTTPAIGKNWQDKRANWMTAQLAAGKTGFLFDTQLICAF